jgi:hypothetical protein
VRIAAAAARPPERLAIGRRDDDVGLRVAAVDAED